MIHIQLPWAANLTLLTLDGTVNYVKTVPLLGQTAALPQGATRPGDNWENGCIYAYRLTGVTEPAP